MSNSIQEFEKKPFGFWALIWLTSTFGLFIYISIKVYFGIANDPIFFRLFFHMLLLLALILAHGWALTTNYNFISDDRKRDSQISVIMDSYETFWDAILSISYYVGCSIVELLFRKHYLKFYNFIKGLEIITDKARDNYEQLKQANDKILEGIKK
jgi:hypothetical protein